VSTPRIDCWDSEENSKIWALKDIDVIDAHPGVIYNAYAHAAAFSLQCASRLDNGTEYSQSILDPAEKRVAEAGIGRFVSTASVARDLLEIMEKAGQKKLKYWGFGYGTFLGVTFASLFPDKIDRMVNDGEFFH